MAAAACYLGIVAVRHGPPSAADAVPLTAVTTALADSDLRTAASARALQNPPGYLLLIAQLSCQTGREDSIFSDPGTIVAPDQ